MERRAVCMHVLGEAKVWDLRHVSPPMVRILMSKQ